MIDRTLASRGKDSFSDSYDATEAIIGKNHLNPDAASLAVVFPPWHGGGRFTQALVNRLARRGAVLEYQFHDQILEPNVERVQRSFNFIGQTIATELQALQGQADYESIHFVGLSLGNVALALAAKGFPDFSQATMVTPGSNLAASMWEGLRTQGIKNTLAAQGINKQELDDAWRQLAPKTHSQAFSGKPVYTFISKNDKIIPSKYQHEMEAHLYSAGSRLAITYSRLGHVATLTRFCITR